MTYAAFTPSRISPSCKSHVLICMKLSGTWLSRGSYRVYLAVMGSTWQLQGLRPVKIVLRGSYGTV